MDLETYMKFAEKYESFKPCTEVQQFVEAHLRGELVETVNIRLLQDFHNPFSYFDTARKILGFVTPTLEWARAMKKVFGEGTVLEVGAGTGLVAKYLNAVGVNIIATDDYSWHKKDFSKWKSFYPVENLDYRDAIKKYNADFLLLCWPMYEDPLATNAAKLFSELNPDGKILYIGEGVGGCTGDDEFNSGLQIIDDLEEVNRVYPQWSGLHDYCSLGVF